METVETEKKNELVQVIEANGLETQTATTLKEKFMPFFDQAEEWKKKAEALVVTDVTQTREMQMARQARLALRDIRINADKTRKALKEDSLRYGKAVQGVYNVIDYLIAPIEKHLMEQERFAEIQEEKRRALVKVQREEEIKPLSEYVPFGIDLGGMSEEDYVKLLKGAELLRDQKIEADRKIEEERLAKEKADRDEQERIRLENEKLKQEAEKREKEIEQERIRLAEEKKKEDARLEKERIENEKKLADERKKADEEKKKLEEQNRIEKEKREKAENELKEKEKEQARLNKEKADREAKELKDKQAEEKKLARQPDKKKLIAFADQIDEIQLPEVKSNEAKSIMIDVKTHLTKTSKFLREKSETL